MNTPNSNIMEGDNYFILDFQLVDRHTRQFVPNYIVDYCTNTIKNVLTGEVVEELDREHFIPYYLGDPPESNITTEIPTISSATHFVEGHRIKDRRTQQLVKDVYYDLDLSVQPPRQYIKHLKTDQEVAEWDEGYNKQYYVDSDGKPIPEDEPVDYKGFKINSMAYFIRGDRLYDRQTREILKNAVFDWNTGIVSHEKSGRVVAYLNNYWLDDYANDEYVESENPDDYLSTEEEDEE